MPAKAGGAWHLRLRLHSIAGRPCGRHDTVRRMRRQIRTLGAWDYDPVSALASTVVRNPSGYPVAD
jgi:hypothetical protein